MIRVSPQPSLKVPLTRVASADDDFSVLPGIGPTLAKRIRQTLRIRTLEQLELAAHTGRLQTVSGMGAGRARRIQRQLDQYFKQRQREAHPSAGTFEPQPPVSELLAIDHEYRVKAHVGALPLVAPKRLNPSGSAWLPVLRTELSGTHYTAFFSNSAAAHQASKTHDWVVVLADKNGHTNQYTVVSDTQGEWRGERVVRGRERECRDYYASWAA